jgi:RHS repeat-associated protein
LALRQRLYRLTQASSTPSASLRGQAGALTTTFQYAYDPVGNRTTQTATITSTLITTYAYDAANRLTNANGQTYTWDDNGNLVNDGGKAYTYDQANRLKSINGSGVAITYAFNGEGARLKQIVNSAVTTYTLDLAAPLVQVLVAKDNSGDTRYLYGVTRIGEQQSAGWLYHLTDALGSVRQLADGSGNVQLARGYTPYGEPLWTNGTASSRYAFTGEDYDPTVGLVFLRARYMQPMLGIFLARDPWGGDQMRPGSMNGWNYGDDNPVNRVDPMGRFSAAALAKSHGFNTDPEGITAWFNSMSDYWGWVSLLLDAQSEDSVISWSGYRYVPWGTFQCDKGNVSLEYETYINNILHRTSNGPTVHPLTRPSPMYPETGIIWRDNGVYSLINTSTPPVMYIDKGDSGHMTDLPDFRLITAAGGPLSGAVLLDRYGNVYGSVQIGKGIAGYFGIGEGYIGVGNIVRGYAFVGTEDELVRAMQGVAVSLSAAAVWGAQANFTICLDDIFYCAASVVYTMGGVGQIGISAGPTFKLPVNKNPTLAWDWMFHLAGPTRNQVWERVLASYANDQCGVCSAR